jgi:peptidoglycan hydrolase-like protein with peptidoglycan-binding domain
MPNDSKPKVIPDGFWMKTRFYREGPYLSVLSTAVANGEPEIFRARVDLRPFERAVRKYHLGLHAEARGMTQKTRDAVNASPAALKPRTIEMHPKIALPRVPVEEVSGSPLVGFAWPGWLAVHIKNATDPARQRWTAFAMAIEEINVANHIRARKNPGNAAFQIEAKKTEEYAEPNGVNTRPDDPFWSSTPERKAFRDLALSRSRKIHFDLHRSFDPGKAIADIGHAIGKIPVIGDVTHIAAEAFAAPLKLAKNIASGARLDHALMGALKDQVKIVKDVAPYAQAVASFIPGIGTGVAAAIGAGTALVEGKSLDEAAKAAIKGALPGGPAAATAFDLAQKVASGENVGTAALESARNLVPQGPAQKAFDVGLAVATGEKLQDAVARGVAGIGAGDLSKVVEAGQRAIASVPGLAQAKKLVPSGPAAQGFDVAAGLLAHSGMNQKAIEAVRAKLAPAAKHGFDIALKAQEKHYPWLGDVVSGASAIGKSAETMGKAALIREVTAFRTGVADRAKTAARSLVPSVPSFGVPNLLSTTPNSALAAYAAANQAWNSIEDGKNAATAVKRIAQADDLVRRVSAAVDEVGAPAALAGLSEAPGLKDALTNALAVKDAASRVTPAVVSKAIGAQTIATQKISDLSSQMKHAADPKVRQAAATSLRILKIVSDNRAVLEKIANRSAREAPHIGCCVGCVGGEPGHIGGSPTVGCSGGCVGCVGAHHGGAEHFANVQMGELPGGYHPHMMTVEGHHGGAEHFAHVSMGKIPGGYRPHQMTVQGHHGGAEHFSNVQMGELPGGYHPHEMTVEGHHGGISHFASVRPGNIRGGYHPHQMTVGAAYHGIVMTLGSSGNMVTKWQKFLNLFPGTRLTVDGVFGHATLVATKSFQSMYDLIPDGVVGPSTLGKAIQIQNQLPAGGLEEDLHVSGHHGGAGHFANVHMGVLRSGYHPHEMTVEGSVHPFDDLVEGRPRLMAERHALARRRHQIADGFAAVDRASLPEDPDLIALCMQQIRRNRALGVRP